MFIVSVCHCEGWWSRRSLKQSWYREVGGYWWFRYALRNERSGLLNHQVFLLTVFHHSKLFFKAWILFGAVFGVTGFHAFFKFFDLADLGFVL